MKRRTFIKGVLATILFPFIPFKSKADPDILKDVREMKKAIQDTEPYVQPGTAWMTTWMPNGRDGCERFYIARVDKNGFVSWEEYDSLEGFK